jgi:hypothetical protein
MRHAKKLLAEKYAAVGVEPERAAQLAGQAIRVLVDAEVIAQGRLDSWERDAQIYHMRGQGVPCAAIQGSFSVSRSRIYDAVKRHGMRRRAALASGAGAAGV